MENGAEMAIFRTIDWLETLENTTYFIGFNPPVFAVKRNTGKADEDRKKGLRLALYALIQP